MLTIKNIRKVVGGQRVLNKASFSLGEGQRAALVGLNGVGKSTLLRIIAGLEEANLGTVMKPNRALMGYLPQEAGAETDETLQEYLRRMTGLTELEAELADLQSSLDRPEIQEKYDALLHEFERLGGYEFERRMLGVIKGLRLAHIPKERPISSLSGGERRKVALAGVLLRGVDILLLDEPTNNLDLPALKYLEKTLCESRTTCLIASHDRRFLDEVANRVIEIDWYKRDTNIFTGNYSQYAETKEHARRRHKEQYRLQEEERSRLTDSKLEKKAWAERVWDKPKRDSDKLVDHFKKERASKKFNSSARALEGREKRMNKLEKLVERDPLEIEFGMPVAGEGAYDIVLKGLVFGYAGSFQAGPLDWQIGFGEKVALLGDNGAGKTTLLKTMTGEVAPLAGEVHVGEGLRFGYLVQEHELFMQNEEEKLSTYLKKRLSPEEQDEIPRLLGDFQLSPLFLDQRMKHLSPGERVRVLLLLLIQKQANVLVLDEPTNHLDLESIEALEEAVNAFPGTIILVTHDRTFLEKVALDRRATLSGGRLSEEIVKIA